MQKYIQGIIDNVIGCGLTYKQKFNKKYGFDKNKSHTLNEISKLTKYNKKGLETIYNKGVGAYHTNSESVRPQVYSPEQWAMARVYASINPSSKASKVDKSHLISGGKINFHKIHWGAFTKQFKNRKNKRLKNFKEFSNYILKHPNEFNKITKKRANFYKNFIFGRGITGCGKSTPEEKLKKWYEQNTKAKTLPIAPLNEGTEANTTEIKNDNIPETVDIENKTTPVFLNDLGEIDNDEGLSEIAKLKKKQVQEEEDKKYAIALIEDEQRKIEDLARLQKIREKDNELNKENLKEFRKTLIKSKKEDEEAYNQIIKEKEEYEEVYEPVLELLNQTKFKYVDLDETVPKGLIEKDLINGYTIKLAGDLSDSNIAEYNAKKYFGDTKTEKEIKKLVNSSGKTLECNFLNPDNPLAITVFQDKNINVKLTEDLFETYSKRAKEKLKLSGKYSDEEIDKLKSGGEGFSFDNISFETSDPDEFFVNECKDSNKHILEKHLPDEIENYNSVKKKIFDDEKYDEEVLEATMEGDEIKINLLKNARNSEDDFKSYYYKYHLKHYQKYQVSKFQIDNLSKMNSLETIKDIIKHTDRTYIPEYHNNYFMKVVSKKVKTKSKKNLNEEYYSLICDELNNDCQGKRGKAYFTTKCRDGVVQFNLSQNKYLKGKNIIDCFNVFKENDDNKYYFKIPLIEHNVIKSKKKEVITKEIKDKAKLQVEQRQTNRRINDLTRVMTEKADKENKLILKLSQKYDIIQPEEYEKYKKELKTGLKKIYRQSSKDTSGLYEPHQGYINHLKTLKSNVALIESALSNPYITIDDKEKLLINLEKAKKKYNNYFKNK